ncbi:MAG: multidrug efflux MFS transporter [Clostridiales Family XIII bacterium]|jgi:EmrB/QacA subfamily drug resistance transporter|nr:multidrug efflux MFS transporter [Clostridiales Family XIII bacterium]
MTELVITKKHLSRRDKLMVAIILLGGFIAILNQTVMSPALPKIMREFAITPAVGQWLTSIFLLVNGLMIPVAAYLINRFSTRQLFIAAMLAFTAGTTLAALSVSFPMLLAARILQAVGAGIQLPFTQVMIMLIFPKERRGFALGISGIVIGLAPAAGPTVAGWLVDEFGWKAIFVGIAPLGVLVMIFAAVFLRNLNVASKSHLDILSVALSTLGFGGVLFGFSAAGGMGWLHPFTIAPIIIGGAAIVFFIRRQLKSKQPLLNLRVLRNAVFSTSTIISSVVASGLTFAAVLTPIFLQDVLGKSALHSGLILMPGAIAMAVISPVSGILFDRFGPRALSIIGLAIIVVGSAMLAFLSLSTPSWYVLVAYTFRMAGISLVNMPVNTWGINALPGAMIAHGNSINNTARQVAGSIGTAVLVTVMMLVSASHGGMSAAASAAGIDAAFAGGTIITFSAFLLAVIRVGRIKRPHNQSQE